MRRNRIIALLLAAPLAAYAVAQTATLPSQQTPAPTPHHPKPHHPSVHHPKPYHPRPAANAAAKEHKQTMKEESAENKRSSHTSTQGKSSVKEERKVNSAEKSEAARETKAHKRQAPQTHNKKKHPSAGHSSAGNRLEMERPQSAASRSRYEDGFRAGFEAGLAARRSEAQSVCAAPPARPALQSATRSLASRSAEPAPAPAEEPHVSDATVRSTTPVSGDCEPAGEIAKPAFEGTRSRPEKASLEAASVGHVVPISLKYSLLLLHEPVPAPMRGTLASLERQNQRLDAEGLQRVEDESDLEMRVARKLLVPLPVSDALAVNPNLDEERRYCRPWTAEFLTDLARMHEAVFHRPLRVDSAVRTVDYQRRLIAVNANAAPAEGSIASPHETGAAVDIAKRGMTWREIGWMRRYLTTLQNAGLIDVEEEFYQSCFHITVYDIYGRHGLLREAGSGKGADRTSDSAAAADGTQGQ
jgi:hypothetical protein